VGDDPDLDAYSPACPAGCRVDEYAEVFYPYRTVLPAVPDLGR